MDKLPLPGREIYVSDISACLVALMSNSVSDDQRDSHCEAFRHKQYMQDKEKK